MPPAQALLMMSRRTYRVRCHHCMVTTNDPGQVLFKLKLTGARFAAGGRHQIASGNCIGGEGWRLGPDR